MAINFLYFPAVYLVYQSFMDKWIAVLSINISYECLNVIVTLLPVILTQELLHRSNVLQFVQEPLVYGSEVMDLINGHTTVKGLEKQYNQCNASNQHTIL